MDLPLPSLKCCGREGGRWRGKRPRDQTSSQLAVKHTMQIEAFRLFFFFGKTIQSLLSIRSGAGVNSFRLRMLFFFFLNLSTRFLLFARRLSLTLSPRPLRGLKIRFNCVYKTVGETFGRALSAHSQTFLVSQLPSLLPPPPSSRSR